MDHLALVGYDISTKDHIDAIFEEMTYEYDVFITIVNSCINNYTIDRIEPLFLAQEAIIEKYHKNLDSTRLSVANIANLNLG